MPQIPFQSFISYTVFIAAGPFQQLGASRAQAISGSLVIDVFGANFQLDGAGKWSGTVTGYQMSDPALGGLLLTVSGLGVTAADFFSAAAGDPTAFAQFLMAGNDTLAGSASRDELRGWGGADLLQGFGGDDFLYGDGLPAVGSCQVPGSEGAPISLNALAGNG